MDERFYKYFIFSLAALLFSTLLSSCSFQDVEVTGIKDVKVTKINKEGIEFNLGVEVNNPNNFSFTIQKVEADVYADNIYLGKVKSTKRLKILKNSTETYPLTFKLEFKDIKKNYLHAFKTVLSRKTNIRVKGFVKARKFIFVKKIDFDKSDTYKFLRLRQLKNLLQW